MTNTHCQHINTESACGAPTKDWGMFCDEHTVAKGEDVMSNTLDETIKEKLGQVIDDLCNMEMPGRYHNQDWAEYALLQLITKAKVSQIRKMDRHIKDVWGVNNHSDYFVAEIKRLKENK